MEHEWALILIAKVSARESDGFKLASCVDRPDCILFAIGVEYPLQAHRRHLIYVLILAQTASRTLRFEGGAARVGLRDLAELTKMVRLSV